MGGRDNLPRKWRQKKVCKKGEPRGKRQTEKLKVCLPERRRKKEPEGKKAAQKGRKLEKDVTRQIRAKGKKKRGRRWGGKRKKERADEERF